MTQAVQWAGVGGCECAGGAGRALPSSPNPPPPPPQPRTKSAPRGRPGPSNLQHGGEGLPGLPHRPPGRAPPGATADPRPLRGRAARTPPAPAAAQPPLPAGQGRAPVFGCHQPGAPRRGRQWEALLPGRGCRYRELRGGGGSRGRYSPSPFLSSFLPPHGARSCRRPRGCAGRAALSASGPPYRRHPPAVATWPC